jgi:hypothetical protein
MSMTCCIILYIPAWHSSSSSVIGHTTPLVPVTRGLLVDRLLTRASLPTASMPAIDCPICLPGPQVPLVADTDAYITQRLVSYPIQHRTPPRSLNDSHNPHDEDHHDHFSPRRCRRSGLWRGRCRDSEAPGRLGAEDHEPDGQHRLAPRPRAYHGMYLRFVER